MLRRTGFAGAWLTALVVLINSGLAVDSFSTADRQAIAAVNEAYRKAWLANDAAAVQRVFTGDAVLLPHHGVAPVVGMDAIRKFWWPAEGLPFTITRLDLVADEIGGHGDFGYLRGHSQVEWTMQDQGRLRTYANGGTFLTLLHKQRDGSWKITHHMWDDPPAREVE